MNIELPILFNSEQQSQLKELGVDTAIEETEVRQVTFYNIDAVAPYYENGNEYSCIHVSGMEFLCPMKYQEVIRKIEENE